MMQERAVRVGKLGPFWRLRPPHHRVAPFDRLPNLLHTQVRDSKWFQDAVRCTSVMGHTSLDYLSCQSLQLLSQGPVAR